jgi:hypothetical protein
VPQGLGRGAAGEPTLPVRALYRSDFAGDVKTFAPPKMRRFALRLFNRRGYRFEMVARLQAGLIFPGEKHYYSWK